MMEVQSKNVGLSPNGWWAFCFLFWLPLLSADEVFQREVVPFFEAHCVTCHGAEKKKGGVSLHSRQGRLADDEELELFELVLEALESGEMPPEDEEQPSAEERKKVMAWIETALKTAASRALSGEEQAPLARRLTNFEYQNTLRDLVGFELKVIDDLPKDPVKPYHFNNTADFMRIGPEQLDRYLGVARRVMASAIVDPEKPEVHLTRREWQPTGIDRGMGSDEIGIWGNRRHTPSWGMGLKGFPETGEFRVRLQASAILPKGVTELPLRLIMGYSINVNSSTQRVEPVGLVRLRSSPDQPEIFEFRGRIENFPVKPGLVQNGVKQPGTLTITPQVLYDDGTLNDPGVARNLAMPRAVINWIEFEGPLVEEWPPAHHTRILFESPLRESDPSAYVREVLLRFISRAYRRPATDGEVERFAKIYQLVLPDLGTLEKAMRETLSMVLISPQFLYHTVAGEGEGERSYEVASRLSYFLWGSMPDAELLDLARQGKLEEAEVLKAQVERLLGDERSVDFARNFTMQWLSLGKVRTVPINRELFPRFLYYVARGERAGTEEPYRPTIRDHMIEESIAFFREMIVRNAPALTVVDSDFAMLNQPLAAHYGVEGVEGHHLRPVAIRPEHRLGGLLTQGAVLIGNSTGSAPHPIYRAVWLREAILGDEVKPPPAEVPALTDTAGDSAENALTIKDLLAKHRNVESCQDCHVRLDPWGIPFERYNAIGKFQLKIPKEGTRVRGLDLQRDENLAGYLDYLETVNSEVIEADSRLPNGPEVAGMPGLKAYLIREKKEEIAENLVRRLLTYAIGRELTFRDRFELEKILRKLAHDQYPLREMIKEICLSPVFLSPSTPEKSHD